MDDDTLELTSDLAAFAPMPTKHVKYGGQTYAVRAWMDLSVREAVEMVRAEVSLSRSDAAGQTAFARRQVELLVPGRPPEVRDRLTPRQVRQVATAARDVSDPPSERKSHHVRFGFWMASLARFYGWTPQVIEALTVRQMFRYLGFVPEIRALEALSGSLVSAYPHLDADARKEVHRQWLRQAGLDRSLSEQIYRVPWEQVRAFIGASR